MSALVFARSRGSRQKAEQALARMPQSTTGHGTAVPFPYVDREAFKKAHDNATINAAIEKAHVTTVPLEGLHAIQHSVKPKRVLQYLDEPHLRPPADLHPAAKTPVDFPVVMDWKGRRLIWDGHHRLTAAKLSGAKEANVRLVRFDD
jgi:hypothetical protein